MPGFASLDYTHATLLSGTAALQCKSGVIGGTAGVARDTQFCGCYVDLQAGAGATLTITGLSNSSGTAASWVINGQITLDQGIILPWPVLNEFAAFTFQPSVSNVIWVFTRAFTGP